MDTAKTITHLSLCTGYGGIDLGLKRVLPTLRTVAYVEIEAFPVYNLVSKIEKGWLDVAPIWTNLKTFPWRGFHKKVDLLSGGFPCQPFSMSGERRGDEDPRHLWPYIVEGIKQLGRPSLVFFENVEGLISSKLQSADWPDPKSTPVLLHVLRELERLGYEATASIFSAEEVGAPHQRKRVFILGKVKSCKEICDYQRFAQSSVYVSERGTHQRFYEPSRTVEDSDSIRRRQGQLKHEKSYTERIKQRSFSALVYSNCARRHADKLKRRSKTKKMRKEKRYFTTAGIKRSQLHRKLESSVGRIINGLTRLLDESRRATDYTNRANEVRMLGNGVVPDCAALAFDVLYNRLKDRR